MSRFLSPLLLLPVLTLGACTEADETSQQAVTSLKVNIEDVVAAGRVTPVDGITSAGQPNAAALAVFRDSGYVAIIDLRDESEDRGFDEIAAVESLGMSYVPFPIASDEDINFDTAKQLSTLIGSQDGPVLVHCTSGNRVGALLALIASLEGADDAAAIVAGKEGGLTRLEDVVRERLGER